MVRTLFSYNQWAHERVWGCILTLRDAQFTQHFDYSIGSVRDQIVHVMSVDARWMARIAGEPVMPHLLPADFDTASSARAEWQQIAACNQGIVAGLSDAQLDEPIDYELTRYGGPKRSTRWQILAHVVNHGTDHRAQVLDLLHRLGAPNVEQDLIYYLWDQLD
ncbi:MAG TPA: DinB family protein [Candidatus Limnocylindrales bacterium]|nr:DinB family protein [Candidatus Limnocylindrales bacterium]